MAANRRARPADPEFDPLSGLPARLRDFDPLDHQRLVVNPFLAVLGLIGLVWLALRLVDSPMPILAGLLMLPLALLPQLIQYHCLDCGRTGPYPGRRGHACPGVIARWHAGERSRIPFPSSGFQLVAWCWALGAVAVLAAVANLT